MINISRRIKSYGGQKSTVPIKDKRYIDLITNYYLKAYERNKTLVKIKQADRNWLLCYIGFNTAFRAEDLLQLRVADVEDGYIHIKENKTGKVQNFRMQKMFHKSIVDYIKRNNLTSYDYLFFSQKNKEFCITRQQADRILQKAAKAIKLNQPFSLHSMRKTFGYQYIKDGNNILTLSKMYNHDDVPTTEIYICWGTDDAENARSSMHLGTTHKPKKTVF